MRSLLRVGLTSLFLFAQTALALHHHEAAPSLRAYGHSGPTASISAKDDCALCGFQIQPRTSTPEPVAVAATSISVVVLSDAPSSAPRAALSLRLRARAPPVA